MSGRHSLRHRSSSKMEPKKGEFTGSIQVKEDIVSYLPTNTCVNIPDSSSGTQNDNQTTSIFPTEIKWKPVFRQIIYLVVFIITAAILFISLRPKSDTVCYIRLGCFSISGPWAERPSLFNFVPQSPSAINTTFFVTSRHDRSGKHGIVKIPTFGHFRVVNQAHIPWSNSSVIVFLIHGYTDKSTTWMRSLKNAFLAQAENMIVVMVDWKAGAKGFYPQVASNTRVVAKEIILFIRHIQRRFGRITPKRIHLVGHSLGSQISGYVGKSLVNSSYPIHQITALDPAFPLFEGYCQEIRLHKSDARHVLAIHSNIGPLGLGMKNRVGTVDIYLNDGRDQRGCPRLDGNFLTGDVKAESKEEGEDLTSMKVNNKSLPKILRKLKSVKDRFACSHRRAYDWLDDILRDMAGILWVSSPYHVKSTPVIAYPIRWENTSDIEFLAKSRSIHFSICEKPGDNGCWKLEKNENDGFFQLPDNESNELSTSTYFIPTTDRSPFCARLVLLEIFTCPLFSSHVTPLLGGIEWESRTNAETNTTLTLSQAAFKEDIPIYNGLLQDGMKLTTWVEFPCQKLQHPVHTDQSKGRNGHHDNDYLSVKITASLAESGSLSNNGIKGSSSKSSRSINVNAKGASSNPSLCVDRMRLSYFNETQKGFKRLHWQSGHKSGSVEKLLISSKECLEVKFPL